MSDGILITSVSAWITSSKLSILFGGLFIKSFQATKMYILYRPLLVDQVIQKENNLKTLISISTPDLFKWMTT